MILQLPHPHITKLHVSHVAVSTGENADISMRVGRIVYLTDDMLIDVEHDIAIRMHYHGQQIRFFGAGLEE